MWELNVLKVERHIYRIFVALCIMILKYRDSIVLFNTLYWFLLLQNIIEREHYSFHEWLNLCPIRQGCNQQLRQGCATYNSESFSWSPNWAWCCCHGFWNQSRLMKIPKISQQNVYRVGVRKVIYQENQLMELNIWLFVNEMIFCCWIKCITMSNVFLEINRRLN